jgi:anaphase-promoting complex subunit 3
MVECVNYSLHLYMYNTTIFIGERLCAEYPSENSKLLASCYLRNNQVYHAYNISKGTQSAPSRYLFALVCLTWAFFVKQK